MSGSIEEAISFLNDKITSKIESAIVLGSGLGGLVNKIEIGQLIPYENIPGFPVSTVQGHSGNLIIGKYHGKHLIILQGRFHYYEGYSMNEVVFPIRVLKGLGIQNLYLSNASGGVNPEYKVGDLMILDDHINLMGVNPLTGNNNEKLGPRFPDMSAPYDKELQAHAMKYGISNGYRIHQGVYAGVTGPCYETRAEYRYIRTIGADSVGMSTVPEVIAARHMDLRCFAISVITDLGGMEQLEPLTHDEVVRVAGEAESKVADIVLNLVNNH